MFFFFFHTNISPLKGTMTLLVIMSSCEEIWTKYQKPLGANRLKSRKKWSFHTVQKTKGKTHITPYLVRIGISWTHLSFVLVKNNPQLTVKFRFIQQFTKKWTAWSYFSTLRLWKESSKYFIHYWITQV